MILQVFSYLQAYHPKLVDYTHWVNLAFFSGTIFLNHETAFKVLGFFFVTFPLGMIQWWNLMDKWQERRAKRATK